MNWYAIGFFLGSIFAFILGILVYLRGREVFLNKIWCLQCFSVSIWQFGRCMISISTNWYDAILWARVLYFGAILIPVLTIHFIFILIEKTQEKKWLLVTGYLLTLAEGIIFNFSNLIIKDVIFYTGFGFYEVPGKAYFFHTVMLGFPTYGTWLLIKKHQEPSIPLLTKNQIRYVIIATFVGFISGATSFFPFINLKIPPFASPFTTLYVFIITYAIAKYRLMAITVVIKKSVTYSFLIILFLVPCLLIVLLSEKVSFDVFDYNFSLILLLLFVFSAFVFPRVKVFFERKGREIFFRDEVTSENVFYDLSKTVTQVLEIDNLLEHIVDIIIKTIAVKKVSILVLDSNETKYEIRASNGFNGEIKSLLLHKNDFLFRWMEEKNEVVIREETEEEISYDSRMNLINEKMMELASEVSLPLIHDNRLVGVVNLGKKENSEVYSYREIEMLKALANQASVAIENARLYDMLRKSKIRMRRADKLASLGTLTAGLAHEIRNPLVSIKTFLQLLPERFDDSEFRSNFLNLTIEEVERICRLLSELLEFARPSEPILGETDINDVLEKVIMLAENEGLKKNLVIHKQYFNGLPNVMTDKEQMKQVFLNIILNAVQASYENGEIFIETRLLDGEKKFVQIEIKDTGKGISEKDIENIFTPFFTTKDGGTGLGLSISHQIVQEHKGTIDVRSKEGNGSSFVISLPLNPEEPDKKLDYQLPEKEFIERTAR